MEVGAAGGSLKNLVLNLEEWRMTKRFCHKSTCFSGLNGPRVSRNFSEFWGLG